NDRTVTDRHSGKHHDVRAEPYVVADHDVSFDLRLIHHELTLVDPVVRCCDRHVRGEQTLLTEHHPADRIPCPHHTELADMTSGADLNALGVPERHVRRECDVVSSVELAHLL